MAQADLDPDAWEESKRLGPSTTSVVRRWNAPTSGFCPIRRDPSLHAPFDKFAKVNEPLYAFVLASLGSSLASAHATSHAIPFIEIFLKHLPTVLEGAHWAQFCADVELAFNADVVFPLCDSSLLFATLPCSGSWASIGTRCPA